MDYDYYAGTATYTYAATGDTTATTPFMLPGPGNTCSSLAKEEEFKPPKKYDPAGARQMWQPGYPRIHMRAEKRPSLMPRFNQVPKSARVRHGRRGAK